MNILFCSAGRRVELLKNFKKSLSVGSRIIATDMSKYAPAIYVADAYYMVPSIRSESYLSTILDICKKESIDAITTLIDPEIEILARNRSEFEKIGVLVLAPYEETAKICFDKYQMYQYLLTKDIPVVPTYSTFEETCNAILNGKLELPVFVKPRTGSGSVGARKVDSLLELKDAFAADNTLIAQKLMSGVDLDADVYIDTISKVPVSIFSKRKLETKIGGASKTISFIDYELNRLIENVVRVLDFNGPVDMDFFHVDGQYYLSEINPRFGGAYLHAYGAGVDFVKLIENNANGVKNQACFGNYDEDLVMMMYDAVIIERIQNE